MSTIPTEWRSLRPVGVSIRWRWPLVVFAAVVVASALQAATVWSLLTWSMSRTESLLTASENRHQQIIGELKQAMVHAVQSESSELSVVRVRLRVDEGRICPPFGNWIICLSQIGDDGVVSEAVRGSPREGDVDFGFRRPGRYLLQIKDEHSWELSHEIVIWPGAPFDRVVRVPVGMRRGQQAQLVLTSSDPHSETPNMSLGSGRIAVCELRPSELVLDGWKWQSQVKHTVFAMIGDVPGEDREYLLEKFVARHGGEFGDDNLPTLLPDGTKPFDARTMGYRLVSMTLCELNGPTGGRPELMAKSVWVTPDADSFRSVDASIPMIRGAVPVAWVLSGNDLVSRMQLPLPRELAEACDWFCGDRGVATREKSIGGLVSRNVGPNLPPSARP